MKKIYWLPIIVIFLSGFASRDIYENIIKTEHIIFNDPAGNKAFAIEMEGHNLILRDLKNKTKKCLNCPTPPPAQY